MLPLHYWERQIQLAKDTAKSVRDIMIRKQQRDKEAKGQLPDKKVPVEDDDNWWPHENL